MAMTTRPLEVMVPKIFDGSAPMTRLTAIDAASGWLNVRRWSAATEKLFQSITVRCVAVVTVISWPAVWIDAAPATTCPLVGRSCAVAGDANSVANAVVASRRRRIPRGAAGSRGAGADVMVDALRHRQTTAR
ncbi:MAG: hypothetical protein PGN17_02460 [Sphingomonas adhaesiva]